MSNILWFKGFQVFLANGETRAFGMELNNTTSVDTLEVPSDQHIKNFIVRCGWYIDAIAIETNKGQTLGQYVSLITILILISRSIHFL